MSSASEKKKAPESNTATVSLGRLAAPTARFEVYFRQFLRPDGAVSGELPTIFRSPKSR